MYDNPVKKISPIWRGAMVEMLSDCILFLAVTYLPIIIEWKT